MGCRKLSAEYYQAIQDKKPVFTMIRPGDKPEQKESPKLIPFPKKLTFKPENLYIGDFPTGYVGDDVLAQTANDTTSYLQYDGHGSTRLLTSATSAIAGRFDYDAYGKNLFSANVTNPASTDMLYSGEQFDPNLQMQYLRARYYDQNNGRFNRLDPFSGNNYDPQSLHKYGYTHCNPVMGIDPTGRSNYSLVGIMSATSVVLTIASLVIPVIGAAYLSIKGKLSFGKILKHLVTPTTWLMAIVSLGIGFTAAVLIKKVLLKFGLETAKKLMAGVGLIFAVIGLGQSIHMTYKMVTGKLPAADAELYVAIMLAGITLSLLLGSALKSNKFKKWFKKGQQSDDGYWKLTPEEQADYERGQSLIPKDVLDELSGDTVIRGQELARDYGGAKGVILQLKGALEVAVNSSGEFGLGDWLGTGPTPLGRYIFGDPSSTFGIMGFFIQLFSDSEESSNSQD